MPGIDWIPGVSQLKAVVQAATGDTEGAKRTVENFCKECPGVSQVTSVVQLATGDAEGAWETQKKCIGTVSNVANGIPVVGHVKGAVHHAFGDHEGGNQALNAATRSTVVVATGAAAGIATGGIGAIPAAITAGVGYDATATAVSGENQGYIAAIKNVSDNPSAGAFIDALAIPVGDGLAGYSGAQMVKKIQVSNLEAAQTAALDKMDAASNSIERMTYGQEALDIHRQIHQIQHGTPVFWDDVKAGTVASEASSSSIPIAVPGYLDESDHKREPNQIFGLAAAVLINACMQQDALYYDSYVKTIIVEDSNRKDAQKKMYERDAQKPEKNIADVYPRVSFTTSEELSNLLGNFGQDPNRDPNRRQNINLNECLRQILSWSWLFLIMPTEFLYTLMVQSNSVYQGLYHSFIRHVNDWAEVIPSDFARLLDRFNVCMTEIQELSAANGEYDAGKARDEFLEALRNLNRDAYNDVRLALLEIQIAMLAFIQANLTYANYLGRSHNTNDRERLYFKVQTERETRVMVLCILDERYLPRTGDNRPLRILVTVYFETWDEFQLHGLLETRAEMEERRQEE